MTSQRRPSDAEINTAPYTSTPQKRKHDGRQNNSQVNLETKRRQSFRPEEDLPSSFDQHPEESLGASGDNPLVDHWRKNHSWPEEYFEADMQAPDFPARSTASSASTGREKDAAYRDAAYDKRLALLGSFLDDKLCWPDDASIEWIYSFLDHRAHAKEVPSNGLLNNAKFRRAHRIFAEKYEAYVVRHFGSLIAPTVEDLYLDGHDHLESLAGTTDEQWLSAFPLTTPMPKPDYCVGFKRETFTEAELDKLGPTKTGKPNMWMFAATSEILFPFLTCEAKRGTTSGGNMLVADRQNAHSATIGVRAIVKLMRLAGRETEVSGKIVFFSISYNVGWVWIWGHFAILEGATERYYRVRLTSYGLTELSADIRWRSYRFVRCVYDDWMPQHLEWTRAAMASIKEPPPEYAWEPPYFAAATKSPSTSIGNITDTVSVPIPGGNKRKPSDSSLRTPQSASSLRKLLPKPDTASAPFGGTNDASPARAYKSPQSGSPRAGL